MRIEPANTREQRKLLLNRSTLCVSINEQGIKIKKVHKVVRNTIRFGSVIRVKGT
jgi:hypothetical protein